MARIGPLIFTLTNDEGEEVRVLARTVEGRMKTFRFPYTTEDEQEIDYLLRRGAKPRRATPPRRPPARPLRSASINQPLEGGEE